MATAAAAEAVKAAITSGGASSATVTTLHTLLCEPSPRPASAKTGAASASTARRAITKRPPTPPARRTPTARGRQAPEVQVLEDVPAPVPAKARYALATEIVNITLKLLTDATKPGPQQQRRASSAQRHSTAKQPSTPSHKALQLRSANATPVPTSTGKKPRSQRRPSQASVTSTSPGSIHLECVAACARLAFSCLRSTDVKTLGIRELPQWHLETGMLSLCGKLLTLDHRALAAKQLRSVKHSLETAARAVPGSRPGPATSAKPSQHASHWSLLLLHRHVHAMPLVLPTLIIYQLHVMQLLVLTTSGSIVERVAELLCSGSQESPAGTILRHVESGADPIKAAKQLETLSRTMLQLCPSISAAADENSRDRTLYAAPLSVFRLQVASLSLQRESRRLMKRPEDTEKDVVGPFSKCLSTLLRRTSSRGDAEKLLETCTASYRSLGCDAHETSDSTGAGFTVLITLSRIAQLAGSQEQSTYYADLALTQCHKLEMSHARYIAASIRRGCAELATPHEMSSGMSDQQDLKTIVESLQKDLSGTSSDYEMLLLELAQVVRLNSRNDTQLEEQKRLLCAAAAFASRYVRLCPGKHVATAQEIVHLALSKCGSGEDVTSWVSSDTASVMIKSGALRRLTDKASSSPLALLCCSSGTAIAFGRILKILVTKAIISGPEKSASCVVDDDGLETAERGTLLELQLKNSLDLAHKPKYRQALSKLVQELVRRLSKTYDAAVFPIRRARLSALVLRVREEYPELLPPHTIAVLSKATLDNITDLAKDEGLKRYLLDVRATLNLSRAFCDGRPSSTELHSALETWNTLLEKADDPADIDSAIDNPTVLIAQLISLEEYLGMLGDDVSRLSVSTLLHKCTQLRGVATEQCGSASKLARVHMILGNAEKARDVLHSALVSPLVDETAPSLDLIEYHLAKAESTLLLDQVDECRGALTNAYQARQRLPPQAVRSSQSQHYKVLHGRAWLVQSRFLMASGLPQDALRAAKQASKIMNSIWATLERNDHSAKPPVVDDGEEPRDPPADALSTKVSKLNLKPAAPGSHKKNELRGASFWPVVRALCESTLHLSDMYVHHGIYNEANHASEQALKTAEAVGSWSLLSDVRAHRGLFLAIAGRFEDSELCLEQEETTEEALLSLRSAQRRKIKAAACAQRGEPKAAVTHLQEAGKIITTMLSQDMTSASIATDETKPQIITEPSAAKSRPPDAAKPASGARAAAASSRTALKKSIKSRAAPTKPLMKPRAILEASAKQNAATAIPYLLRKIQAEIAFNTAAMEIKYGSNSCRDTSELQELYAGQCHGIHWRSLEQEVVLSKTIKSLEADFSLSVLTESVLSYPSLQLLDSTEVSTTSATVKAPPKSSRSAGGAKKVAPTGSSSANISPLTASTIHEESSAVLSTIEAHKQYDLLSTTCMITSATPTTRSRSSLELVKPLSFVDQGRIHASQSMMAVACLERVSNSSSDSFAWPNEQLSMPSTHVASASFQSEYIDNLPQSWTVVSLCLSESCEELCIARYRGSQAPVVLRIPFSRQKSDETEEEPFLFEDGKSELEEIISLSNFSCHSTLDTSAKGAKTNWWAEREALDRRMHELLINMENLWLGGFRGIMSQHGRNQEQLDRFRKAFEAMLDRHLPSRRGSKRGSKRLVLDDQILELFVGLGSDQDGELELDELLAELLYFVVDILQFNGERNAYDEVDIDRMVVDVLDAMRSYHDSDEKTSEGAHLILVLDRRLQAFPWESLPCFEHVSVSRMDSMHSLRDRIIAMRQQVQASKLTEQDRYIVPRSSGTYIVNPGGDLKSTESILTPELSQLAASEGSGWKSIVRHAPSEDEFKSALSSTSTLLYFGHGAGSQYIRPRTVRRLEKCSEVVWLMGCSSGAVTEYGKLEAFAVPLTYMLAGQTQQAPELEPAQSTGKCMSVLATLWDVTDKDIDRFSLAVGEDWGLWKAPQASTKLPAKTPRKREKVVAPSTPEKTCKTPKTPKVKKTPVPPKTPVRSGSVSRERGQKKISLVEAVARNRDACYLRYLNGAAPVVYGIPVWLGD
ncbi:Separin [Fulvia fulva]|uniref:separase n=1 Tax=Passalora fulva TaxID=5499 RepID=A0A9Q8L633_PASFU|nr:Separin [Fulvia fulva]KAK4635102.1 Separin [Fulvia fulva]UJO10898.1 Separin [Fulvia fulva]WPV09498.1 Separin [Fulvia fulva]WPV24726.1 Separin [Fulvia fulva]